MSFRNITISGLPGNGSTTLLKLLRESLEKDGWKGFSGGEFMRMYAMEKGLFDPKTNKFHHDATVYGEDFDREVDFGMRTRLEKESHWILESWLSGFMAQKVPNVLKVLLICSDDAVRIDRIVNRDDVSIDEAKSHITERKEKNVAKWARMYKKEWNDWVVGSGKAKPGDPIDFWRPSLYDIVIDTYSSSREETLETVSKALQQK
jgi:cytidylate kinase